MPPVQIIVRGAKTYYGKNLFCIIIIVVPLLRHDYRDKPVQSNLPVQSKRLREIRKMHYRDRTPRTFLPPTISYTVCIVVAYLTVNASNVCTRVKALCIIGLATE